MKEQLESNKKINTDNMTCCQGIRSYASAAMSDSGKMSWPEHQEITCPKGNTITCGMLPTLRALASKECDIQGSVCLVPFDVEMDAASHLQMILLEAYCRENGIKVLRVSRETLKHRLCPGSADLSCVLISNDDPFVPNAPE